MADNNSKKFYLTSGGFKKIREEYKKLVEIKGLKARDQSPEFLHSDELNPEYASYQEDLGFLNQRMTDIEAILRNYELIKAPPKEKRDVVEIGATVVVELNGQLDEFTIVGTLETDPSLKRISDKSPIGQALLGKKVGDIVEVKTPIVNHKCKIIKIKYKK